MKSGMSALTELIDKLVQEQTLSLDAIDTVSKIRDQLSEATRNVKALEAKALTDSEDKMKLRNQVSELEMQNGVLKNEVAALRKTDEQSKVAILREQYAELRRQDCFEMVRLIFRNPITHRRISECGSAPAPSGSGQSTVGVSSSTTITENRDANPSECY